ncbi:MAG: hypothetical protein AABW79_02780 [Nanoarchaeota archaeon]
MPSCCALGDALYEPRVIHKSDNFFVMPSRGPRGIIGYLLITSKEHNEGMGSLPASFYPELDDVVDRTKARIKEKLNMPSLVFEHGPRICGVRGGGCLDHAHFHVVPDGQLAKPLASTLLDYMSQVGSTINLEKTKGYDLLRACYEEGRSSYMYVDTEETLSQLELFVKVNFNTPSQFMRRIISKQGNPKLWDWRTHPDEETMQKTLDIFGKF